MDSGASRISVHDLAVGYDGHIVQSGIDVEIGSAEIFAIVGGSGSGKSTVLRTMIGLLPPISGRILFDGAALSDRVNDGPPPFGGLFQSGAVLSSITVLDSLYTIADRMMFLDADEHRPIAIGPPSELAISSNSAKVRDFLRRRKNSSSQLKGSGHAS